MAEQHVRVRIATRIGYAQISPRARNLSIMLPEMPTLSRPLTDLIDTALCSEVPVTGSGADAKHTPRREPWTNTA
jgi:hypothetical protein